MRKIIGLLLLVLSWIVIFYILRILTEFVFVPWDTAITRPEIGTWQRTLNDFFELPPGNFLIASLLTLTSIYLTTRRTHHLLLVVAVGNIVFALLVMGVFMVAALVNNALFPHPPVAYDPTYRGYYRSIIPGLTLALACCGWLRWQASGNQQLLRRWLRRSEL